MILSLACSSPQKNFEKGNYEKAYTSSLEDYKKGKRSRQTKDLMNRSFQELIKETTNSTERYLQSDLIEDWEEAFTTSSDLIDLYYDGKGYIDKAFDSPISRIESDTDALGTDIASGFFELGQQAMIDYRRNEDKVFAQNAFAFYGKAQLYNGTIEDIEVLIEEALSYAIVNVLVVTESPFEYRYIGVIDEVFRDIERESEGFYQISYKRNLPNADCVLEIDFSRLDIDTRESRNTEEFSEEIEDGYETQVDTSGNSTRVQKYTTVTCSVTTLIRDISYSWRAAVSTDNSRNYCEFNYRYFDATETTRDETYQISGDRRALPSRFNQSTTNTNRRTEDVVEELIEEIYDQVVRNYIRGLR